MIAANAPPAGAGPGEPRWGVATITLHWLSALLILALLGLGWFMVHGKLRASTQFDLYQLHKSLGFLSLALLLLRFGARLAERRPPAPAAMRGWERAGARLAHLTFYGLLLAAVFTGWLRVSSALIPVPSQFFGLFVIPNLTGPDATFSGQMALIHYIVARLIVALLVLHVAAALKHHFIDRDEILSRMLPRR